MPNIPFTQYLRPDGRKVGVVIDRPEAIASMALKIMQAGYVFEVEHLTTGEASLTIADPKKGVDVAIKIVPNGPKVPGAVDDMITDFYATLKTVKATEQ